MSEKARRTRLAVHGFSVVVEHRMCAQLAAIYCLEEILIGLCMGRRQELNNSNKNVIWKKCHPNIPGLILNFLKLPPFFAVLTLKRHCLPISQKATKFNKLYIYTHRKKRQSCDFFFFYCNLLPDPQSFTETHKKACFAIRVIFFICIYLVLFYLFIYYLLLCSNSALKLI